MRPARRIVLAITAAIALLAVLPGPRLAEAHMVGLAKNSVTMSRGEWKVDGATVTADLVFMRHQVVHLVVGPEGDERTPVDDAALEGAVSSRIDLARGDRPCQGAVEPVAPPPEGAWAVRLRWHCPEGPEPIRAALRFVTEFGLAHRHLAVVDDGAGSRTEVVAGERPHLDLRPRAGDALAAWRVEDGIRRVLAGWELWAALAGAALLLAAWRVARRVRARRP